MSLRRAAFRDEFRRPGGRPRLINGARINSCFCFVWIGAPVAIWLRRAETLTIFFACFLPILLVYYPLLAYGIDAAKRGSLPPFSVWLGNVMLLAIGGWFLRKVWRIWAARSPL